MVKIFMWRGCSTEVSRRGVLDSGCHGADRAQAEQGQGRAERCSCLDGCVLRDTTQQHNTHIRDLGEVCYAWHPWHGRTVRVHARLVKRGLAVAHCSLEEVQTGRALEVPLWMLDVAACGKIRVSKCAIASVQSLRELREILESAQRPTPNIPESQHRYWLDIGGADGSITGPAKNEPAHDVCSSAMPPALDSSVARCATQDNLLDGAVPEAASRKSCRSGNGRGGAR